MADERQASATLTITDQMSAPLHGIGSEIDDLIKKFDELQRKGGETSGALSKRFEEASRSNKGKGPVAAVGDDAESSKTKLGEFEKFFSSWEKRLGSQLQGLNKEFMAATGGSNAFGGAVGAVTGLVSKLGSAVGTTTLGLLGMGAAGVGATVGMFNFAKGIGEAYEANQRLRLNLGEFSGTAIKNFRAINDLLGVTKQQSDAIAQDFAKSFFDLQRGSSSPLFQAIATLPGGLPEAGRLRAMQRAGATPLQGMDQLMREFVPTLTEGLKRELANRLGLPQSYVLQYAEKAREAPQPYRLPDAERLEFERDAKTLARATRTLTNAFDYASDYMEKGFKAWFSRTVAPWADAARRQVERRAPIRSLSEEALQGQVEGPGFASPWTDEDEARSNEAANEQTRRANELGRRRDHFRNTPGVFIPTPLRRPPEAPKPDPIGPPADFSSRFYFRRGGRTRTRQQEDDAETLRQHFMPPPEAGAGPISELTDQSRESTNYLREIRDTLREGRVIASGTAGVAAPTGMAAAAGSGSRVASPGVWSRVGTAAVNKIDGLLETAKIPGDVWGGKYTYKPQTPGVWTEDDEFHQQQLARREVGDAFRLSGYGAQATSNSLLRNLVPESMPGAIGHAGDSRRLGRGGISGAAGVSGAGVGTGTDGVPGSAAGPPPPGAMDALSLARQHLGEDEIRDQGKLQAFFASKGINIDPSTTAWCAAFVNANLSQAGFATPKNKVAAGAWSTFGAAVNPDDVRAGDVGVVRGRSPRTGLEGKHVAFLTGESRTDPRTGERQFEMLGGNQGGTVSGQGGVSRRWYSESQLHFRRPVGPDGAPQQPDNQVPSAGGGGLASERISQEMQRDPDLRRLLMASTQAEVGGQGPVAEQSYMESVRNRALARNKTLRETLSSRSYYPGRTQGMLNRSIPETERARLDPTVDAVLGGSNRAGFATGNASMAVGFGGGPTTVDMGPGRERFGIEAQDLRWARRMRRESQDAPVDRAAVDRSVSAGAIAGGMVGKASVDVNFSNVPPGVKTKASGEGAFEDIRLKRSPQMGTTGGYGGGENNAYAEE
jgi:uncharacterized protein (TIGR02594 family)